MNVISTNFAYKDPLVPLDLNNVKYIIVHHADAAVASPEDIHRWHSENGWSGFGYNEYIRKDGTVYIGRGDNIGAQCLNYNSISYGICCEGAYDTEENVPSEQLNSLVARINYNKARFKNFVEVVPHSRFFQTSCPGKYFPKDLNSLAIDSRHTDLMKYLGILKQKGIINSPDYWIENAVDGKMVKGEFAANLIQNVAKALGQIS